MQALMDARLTIEQAAQVLGSSERQVWRLLAGAREDGLAGLLNGSRGREHVTCVCRESLRKRLRSAGIAPERTRRPRKYRSRRERRAAAGMLLQIDASRHDWLEGRRPSLTLVGPINGATNRAWTCFSQAATTWAYMELMCQVAPSAGLPLSLYSDRQDISYTRREPSSWRTGAR